MAAAPYDVLVAGSGPAGMTAALYGRRLGLKMIVCGDIPGGNLYMIGNLSNFPGFIGGISGMELGAKLFQQAQSEGAEFTMSRLKKLQHEGGLFQGLDADGQTHLATTAVIATGRVPMRLSIGKAGLEGIHFCSVCDGPLYRNRNATLAVVGSDNAAAQHATTLARIARKVLLIHRSTQPRMDAGHLSLVQRQENITILGDTELVDLTGLDMLESLVVQSRSGQRRDIPVAGLFLAMGWRPNTDLLELPVEKTVDGYLKTDPRLMTSFAGLFAAGDVRDTDLWQVLLACADGARVAKYAAEYISGNL